ncbi:MAG: hypothetical protein LBR48_04490 [Dysgonamonadaceae bacterium]|jgi:membrane-bound ClpP family serine protease|nr:hypothetical protein [Dysgonamonadaceae bacterium]
MTFNITIVAVVILLGILFLLIEIFLLPGISIAGIAGALLIVGGIVYAYLYLGTAAGNITLFSSGIVLGGAFIWLLRSKSLRKIALDTEIKESVDNSDLKKIQPGDTGVTLSRLNPIGRVLINDVVVEGKTANGELLGTDVPIKALRVDSHQVVVIENN